MPTVKVRLLSKMGSDLVIPIVVPDLDEVRTFADQLHRMGKNWSGEAFGWQAEYDAEEPEPPLDSKMTFTPADFCIGESGIWFFSLMWEYGADHAPVEFLDDRNIIAASRYNLHSDLL